MVFAKDALSVKAPFADNQLAFVIHGDLETTIVQWRAARANDVARYDLRPVLIDRILLVPISVHLDATLLHQDAAVMFPGIESQPAEIALHQHLPNHRRKSKQAVRITLLKICAMAAVPLRNEMPAANPEVFRLL